MAAGPSADLSIGFLSVVPRICLYVNGRESKGHELGAVKLPYDSWRVVPSIYNFLRAISKLSVTGTFPRSLVSRVSLSVAIEQKRTPFHLLTSVRLTAFFRSPFLLFSSLSLFHPIHRDIRKIKRLENKKKKKKKWTRIAEGSRFSFSLSSKQHRGSSTLRSLDQTRESILQFPSKTGCFKIPADVVLPANEYHRVFVTILRPLPNFYRRTNERKKEQKFRYTIKVTREQRTHTEFLNYIFSTNALPIGRKTYFVIALDSGTPPLEIQPSQQTIYPPTTSILGLLVGQRNRAFDRPSTKFDRTVRRYSFQILFIRFVMSLKDRCPRK